MSDQVQAQFQKGWEFASGIVSAGAGSHMGVAYVEKVQDAISALEDSINKRNNNPNYQGLVLEKWSSGTFNVDAVAAQSKYRATALEMNTKNSIDVQVTKGEEVVKNYGAKSYATAEKTANAQAIINKTTGEAAYKDQMRLVPEDQLEEVKNTARRRMLKNSITRPDVSEANKEVFEKATDKIETADGTSSKAISRKDLDKIAKEARDERFKAEDYGITADSAIKAEYLIKQSLKAGTTAAAISMAFTLTPEIIKAFDYLIKNGEMDVDQIKAAGEKAISTGAEGFLRGFVASALFIACESGKLGENLVGVNATTIGILTSFVMQIIKDSVLLASGKITAKEMGMHVVDFAIISAGFKLGGLIATAAVGSGPAAIGFLVGSLVGAAFCISYNVGKKKLISFCADTGFTCFGLVDQDYTLPESILEELGVETVDVIQTQLQTTDVQRTVIPTVDITRTEYETVKMTVLRRGVIGVSKVGYVF